MDDKHPEAVQDQRDSPGRLATALERGVVDHLVSDLLVRRTGVVCRAEPAPRGVDHAARSHGVMQGSTDTLGEEGVRGTLALVFENPFKSGARGLVRHTATPAKNSFDDEYDQQPLRIHDEPFASWGGCRRVESSYPSSTRAAPVGRSLGTLRSADIWTRHWHADRRRDPPGSARASCSALRGS